jgi:hypothetical protein
MLSPAALRRLRTFARVGYVIVILLATLTHLQVDPDPERIAMRLRRALHWREMWRSSRGSASSG